MQQGRHQVTAKSGSTNLPDQREFITAYIFTFGIGNKKWFLLSGEIYNKTIINYFPFFRIWDPVQQQTSAGIGIVKNISFIQAKDGTETEHHILIAY